MNQTQAVPTEDQLKQWINERLEGTPFRLESHGNTLHVVGGELPEPLTLELQIGNDRANFTAAEKICAALLAS